MEGKAITVGSDEWMGRTGESWAAEWRRTDRSFSMLTERLLERIRDHAFGAALDIGCGAGELSLAIARSRPQGPVIGLDISPQLIAAARQRAGHHANATFELGDAATWRPDAPFTPELLVSRHGVMFFADPVAAFVNLRELAAPGAVLLFSCFRDWDQNPAFAEIARLLPAPPPSPPGDAPGPFGFSDRARVENILVRAGWTNIAFESFDFAMIVGGGTDPVADTQAYFASIGPAARALREMDEGQRQAFFDRLRAHAEEHLRDGLVLLRAASWIVSARRF
jgi:SAM-dependent methyltransferase